MTRKLTLLTILLVSLAAAGRAQTLEREPGYVPIQELGLFPQDKLEVEIDIEGPALRLIAAAAKDDPGFASVMAGLKAIQVQVFPMKGADAAAVKTRIGRAVHWLEGRGWKSMVRVRDQGQETYIYLKQTGDRIEGMTLLSLDPRDEAVVINIVGRVDPAQIGQLAQKLNVPQLKKIPTRGSSARKPE